MGNRIGPSGLGTVAPPMKLSPNNLRLHASAGGTAVLLLLASGCGGSSVGNPGGTGSSSDLIKTIGGTVTLQTGRVILAVPADAVAKNTPVTARTPGSLPSDGKVVTGTPVELSDVKLSKSVVLSLAYPSRISEGAVARLRVAELVDGAWSVLPSTISPYGQAISTRVQSFGTYSLYLED